MVKSQFSLAKLRKSFFAKNVIGKRQISKIRQISKFSSAKDPLPSFGRPMSAYITSVICNGKVWSLLSLGIDGPSKFPAFSFFSAKSRKYFERTFFNKLNSHRFSNVRSSKLISLCEAKTSESSHYTGTKSK